MKLILFLKLIGLLYSLFTFKSPTVIIYNFNITKFIIYTNAIKAIENKLFIEKKSSFRR